MSQQKAEIITWGVEPLVRDRRGLEDLLFLSAPRISILLIRLALRGPPGSKFRRAVITRAVRLGFAANNRGDYRLLTSMLDPAIELSLFHDEPSERAADLEAQYFGREGYVQSVEHWRTAFVEHRWELTHMIDGGGSRFAARADMVGRGAGSGIEVRDCQFHVWEIGDRGLRRQWVTASEDAMRGALEAAGLPESGS
jgi:hypothetical protein